MLSTNKNNKLKYNDSQVIFQNLNEPSMKDFKVFLNNPDFKAIKGDKGDKKMNYWSIGGSFGLYHIPDEYKIKYVKLYDNCRKAGLRLNFMESQPINGSLFDDYDIYQIDKVDCLSTINIYKMVQETCENFKEMIDFSDIISERTIHIVVTKRPLVVWDEEKKAWKNGLHVYIPSIQLESKADRQLRLINMKKRKGIENIIGPSVIESEVANIIDIGSAWVPPLLFGSAKVGKEPYVLNNIYTMTVEANGNYILQNDADLMIYYREQISNPTKSRKKKKKSDYDSDEEDDYRQKKKYLNEINLTQEFCTSIPGKYIKSNVYKMKSCYTQDLDRMKLKAQTRGVRDDDQTDLENMYNAMSYLAVNDHNATYIKEILDMLPPKYYDTYTLWFKVIYILANTCILYKPLAKWFSRKSSKWTTVEDFEGKWTEAIHGQRYSLHITHLYKWARKYNKSKVRELDDNSAFQLVQNFAFDEIVEGNLQHDHIAKIMDILLKNKYVSDAIDKTNKRFLWYEFIFPDDKARPGQIFKWATIENPTNMYLYISEKIPNLIKQVISRAKNQMTKIEDDKDKIKYYGKIVANLQKSGRSLSNNTFREQVVKAASMRFLKPHFSKELNQHEFTMGVGNGILLLSSSGALPTLVQQYNDLKVSHYTETAYIEFDPDDPITQKLLLALRTRHPNDHTDVYEYVMGFHASSIDHRPRAHLFLMITGPGRNGKSFGSELHKNALGDTYARAMPVTMLTTEESGPGAADPVLLTTKDARYCMYSEGPKCVALYTPRVKRMTGGDTQTARGLYSNDVENFNPRCVHIAFSNFDFEINESGIAIWERVRYIIFPMTFKSERDYNPADPYQRILDRTLNDEFVQRAETKARYLSIMTFYHMKLMHLFDGVVEKIPHPTVDQMTLTFQIEQDTVTKFAQQHLVHMAPGEADDEDAPAPIRAIQIAKKYILWYGANIKERSNLQIGFIEKTIKESIFKNYLKDTHGVYFLKKGYRLRDSEVEELKPGEKIAIVLTREDKNLPAGSEPYFKSETPIEFIARVKSEWEELKLHDRKIKAKMNGISAYDDFNEEGDEDDSIVLDDDSNPNESMAKKSKDKAFEMDTSVLDDMLSGKTPYAKYKDDLITEIETIQDDQLSENEDQDEVPGIPSEDGMINLLSFL
jgi:phage/plasmid-associated DNA primase